MKTFFLIFVCYTLLGLEIAPIDKNIDRALASHLQIYRIDNTVRSDFSFKAYSIKLIQCKLNASTGSFDRQVLKTLTNSIHYEPINSFDLHLLFSKDGSYSFLCNGVGQRGSIDGSVLDMHSASYENGWLLDGELVLRFMSKEPQKAESRKETWTSYLALEISLVPIPQEASIPSNDAEGEF